MVDKLNGYLEDGGHEVKMVAYESKERDYLPSDDADLFGVAFPTYGLGAPPNMKRYAYELNAREGLKFFVLTTYRLKFGRAAMDYANILKKKGMEPMLAMGVKMPMNIPTRWPPMIEKPTKEEDIPKFKEEALKQIETIADALHKGENILDRQHFLYLYSKFENFMYHRYLIPQWNRGLKVNSSCTKCGKVVESCPVGNITLTDEGIRFNGRCMVCGRCLTFCPQNAIYVDSSFVIPNKRYAGVGEGYKPPKVENL